LWCFSCFVTSKFHAQHTYSAYLWGCTLESLLSWVGPFNPLWVVCNYLHSSWLQFRQLLNLVWNSDNSCNEITSIRAISEEIMVKRGVSHVTSRSYMGFNVIIEYQKRNTEWFLRYQTYSKNISVKLTKFRRHSDRVEVNQEYKRHSSLLCVVATQGCIQRAFQKQLTPDISQSPMLTTNRLSRCHEASNCYQAGEYDTSHESATTTTIDPFQTNFLMSSTILNLDVGDQLSSATVPFDASQTTMYDLRASLDVNLLIASSTLKSELWASYLGDFSTDLPLRHSHFKTSQMTLLMISSVLNLNLQAPYLGDFSTDIPSRHFHFETSQMTLPMTSSVLDSDLQALYLDDVSTDVPSRNSHFEASQTTLPMTLNVLDLDLQALYLDDFFTDVPSRNFHFKASQMTLPMTSSVLNSDLRALYLVNFPADMPARPSQLDASSMSFSTTSIIPNLDLCTPLDNQPATTAAAGPFQMNFLDPWIILDPFSPTTFNALNSDSRAPYYGNYPMDLPAWFSQFEHSSTFFLTTSNILDLGLRASCVDSSPLSLSDKSLTELDCTWES